MLFFKGAFPGFSALIDAIHKELKSLQPKDSSTIRWTRDSSGMSANLVTPTPSAGGIPAEEEEEDSSQAYSGYFKVIDTRLVDGGSTTLKISVVDGADADSEFCGHATFNATEFDVSVEEITVTASGFLFLKSTMGVDTPPLPLAPEFEYVASWPSASDGVGRRLIATVAVYGAKMTITQQQHGEVQAFIWGACE